MQWDRDTTVIKSNKLNSAQQEQLSMVEQRVLQLAMIDAHHKQLEGKSKAVVQVHASQYAQVFGVARASSYDALMDAAEKLPARTFIFEDDLAKGKKTKWVSGVEYLKDQGVIEVKFSKAVHAELPKGSDYDKKDFVSYDINDISGITSAFTFRLFEILTQYKSAGKTPLYSLERLRGLIGLDDGKYTRMTDFKRIIINEPLETINSLTDLNADYEQKKEGRAIAFIQFVLNKKKGMAAVMDAIDENDKAKSKAKSKKDAGADK